MKILVGDFNAKVHIRWRDIFKLPIGNESFHEISNDNGVRAVNFATYKNLTARSTMFPHHNIHKFMCTSPDGMSDHSGQQIVILTTTWWWQKLERDWQ
jgi:hypothetical protein